MASTVRSGDSTAAGAAPDAAGREKADAAKLLDLVIGAEVLAAIHEGFLQAFKTATTAVFSRCSARPRPPTRTSAPPPRPRSS